MSDCVFSVGSGICILYTAHVYVGHLMICFTVSSFYDSCMIIVGRP